MVQWIKYLVGKCFQVKSSGGCRFNPTSKNNKELTITYHLCPVMVNRTGIVYTLGSNKGFSVGSV